MNLGSPAPRVDHERQQPPRGPDQKPDRPASWLLSVWFGLFARTRFCSAPTRVGGRRFGLFLPKLQVRARNTHPVTHNFLARFAAKVSSGNRLCPRSTTPYGVGIGSLSEIESGD